MRRRIKRGEEEKGFGKKRVWRRDNTLQLGGAIGGREGGSVASGGKEEEREVVVAFYFPLFYTTLYTYQHTKISTYSGLIKWRVFVFVYLYLYAGLFWLPSWPWILFACRRPKFAGETFELRSAFKRRRVNKRGKIGGGRARFTTRTLPIFNGWRGMRASIAYYMLMLNIQTSSKLSSFG